MPEFEQRCLPSVVVQARHSRFVSVHPCGADSSSANVKNIVSSFIHDSVGSLPVYALLRQVTDYERKRVSELSPVHNRLMQNF
jgi:hypothetical protein